MIPEAAEVELLVRRHAGAVWRVAVALLRDDFAAEQAVRDTFAAALDALPAYEDDDALRAWLVEACVEVCAERVPPAAPAVPHDAGDRRHLDAALRDLAPAERAAFVLVDVLGWAAGDPAVLTRARSRLAESLAPAGAEAHDDVRAALVSDQPVPADVRDHVAGCNACVGFARGLDRVRRAAPLLAPAGPPPGLADRLVASLVEPPPAEPVRRTFGRRALVRVAVAVVVAVVVAAVALRPGEPTPRAALAAAARRTEAAGSAKVRVDGSATFVLPVRDAVARPDLESVPGELRGWIEGRWRALRAAPSITTTVTMRAAGDVAFGERLRLAGTVGVERQAAFDLVAGRGGVAVRTEGGSWAVATGRAGPWSAVVGGPDDLVQLVHDATGVTRTADGYRFRVAIPDGTVLAGEAVLAGGRLSSVRLSASGRTGGIAGATWATDLLVELSEPGVAVAPEPVDIGAVRDRAPAPDGPSRLIYPLGAGVRAAVG